MSQQETTFSRLKSDPEFADFMMTALAFFLKDSFDPDMRVAYKSIHDHEEMLRQQYGQGVVENRQVDVSSMQLVTSLCPILLKYFKPKYNGLKEVTSLPGPVRDVYEAVALSHCKQILAAILAQFVRLSGAVRGKHKEFLAPELMRWESFQRMVWVLNSKNDGEPHEILFSAAPDASGQVVPQPVLQSFMGEYLATEQTIEAVVYGIIDKDVRNLCQLAWTIKLDVESQLPADYVYRTTDLMAMSAAAKRYGDLVAIKELSELLVREFITKTKTVISLEEVDKVTGETKPRAMIGYEATAAVECSSIFERQAALQLLVKVGEKLTGKHLSLQVKQWDPTTDWQAFITIRDAIIHADESGNYLVIRKLIQSKDRLKKIMQELPILHERVTRLAASRYSQLPKYQEDHEAFWGEVYQFELQSHGASQASSSPTPLVEREAILSEDKVFFIGVLRNSGRSEAVVNKWEQIFEDSSLLPRNKREYGKLLKEDFPAKGAAGSDEREIFNRCKKIVVSLKSPKSDLASRQAMRRKVDDAASQKKESQEQAFNGFVEIRGLAKEFLSVKDRRMSLYDAVMDCVFAVKDVHALVEMYIDKDLMRHLSEDFKLTQLGDDKIPLIRKVMKVFNENPMFRHALEYNLSTCMLHLPRLESMLNMEDDSDFKKLYKVNREFRNYVVHGNLFTDTEVQAQGKAFVGSNRDLLIPCFGLGFFSRLLPHLEPCRDQLVSLPRAIFTNTGCLSSSVGLGLLLFSAFLFVHSYFQGSHRSPIHLLPFLIGAAITLYRVAYNPRVDLKSAKGFSMGILYDVRDQSLSARRAAQQYLAPWFRNVP